MHHKPRSRPCEPNWIRHGTPKQAVRGTWDDIGRNAELHGLEAIGWMPSQIRELNRHLRIKDRMRGWI